VTTDPADADHHDEDPEVSIELPEGWTLTAPAGTDPGVLQLVADTLADEDYLLTVEDAVDKYEEQQRRASAPPEPQRPISRSAHLFLEHLARDLASRAVMDQFIYGQRKPQTGPVIYETSNPGRDSPLKARFTDGPIREDFHGIAVWDADDTDPGIAHVEIIGEDGRTSRLLGWDHAGLPAVAALAARWAKHPPARPGWTGSITGPPRPIPIKPSPWQTLPKGMFDGERTVIIEPGADSNPDARRLELHDGKWVDVGPWFPNGLAPAYRGRPAPLPWSHPDADPIADMKAAVEDQ
jgi:hypothetical protein